MSAVALIPARGGSRRIPRKNLRPFLGVPAITRTIATVVATGVVDRVVVSTDDDEIAALAVASGAEVPARRPQDLADDTTTTVAVVRHAIGAWLSGAPDDTPLWVVYPTAVLLRPDDLRAAAARFAGGEAEFLVPLLRYPHPVERRLRLTDAGLVRSDEPQAILRRTQDLPPAFHDAGQFYLGRIAAWRRSSPLESTRAIGFELAPDRAVDLDEPAHWELAEALGRTLAARTGDPSQD